MYQLQAHVTDDLLVVVSLALTLKFHGTDKSIRETCGRLLPLLITPQQRNAAIRLITAKRPFRNAQFTVENYKYDF